MAKRSRIESSAFGGGKDGNLFSSQPHFESITRNYVENTSSQLSRPEESNQTPTTPSTPPRRKRLVNQSPSAAKRGPNRWNQGGVRLLNAENRDRFIPCRQGMNPEQCRYLMYASNSEDEDDGTGTRSSEVNGHGSFNKVLREVLLPPGSTGSSRRVLAFSDSNVKKTTLIQENAMSNVNVMAWMGGDDAGGNSSSLSAAERLGRQRRVIPNNPVQTLDAPDLLNDYYLNLLSWSSNNVLAVALAASVYLWNATTREIQHLLNLGEGADVVVTSLKWGNGARNSQLAVGVSTGEVQMWDTAVGAKVRTLQAHSARVGTLAWRDEAHLCSGSRDATIKQHDMRIGAQGQPGMLVGHQQEVCGLEWSPDGHMLASGGNENFLCLWDAAMSGSRNSNIVQDGSALFRQSPRVILEDHCAAVKAIAWSPHQRNLLASGGGTADRCIKLWNTGTGTLLKSLDTESQVCALLWSRHTRNELVSGHGFSRNQLCLWHCPSLTRIKELSGHSSRVLHMAMSPDGTTVVSAAADETLRFWTMFTAPPIRRATSGPAGLSLFQLR